MTDSQVILFGSFSEDEAKALQSSPSDNYGTNSPAISPNKGVLTVSRQQELFQGPAASISSNQQVVVLTSKRVTRGSQCKFPEVGSELPLRILQNENGGSLPEKDPPYQAFSFGKDILSEPSEEKVTEDSSLEEKIRSQKEIDMEFNATKPATSNGQIEDAFLHGQEQVSGDMFHSDRLEKCTMEISIAGIGIAIKDSGNGKKYEESLKETPEGGASKVNFSKGLQSFGRRLQPRGLMNTGNSCFLNATLQALLSCSPFWHLVQSLRTSNTLQMGYPTLRAMIDFVGEFESVPVPEKFLAKGGGEEESGYGEGIEIGRPFAPTMFEPVLRSFNPDTCGALRKSRQEDAQEFLSYLMDQMHEELLQLTSVGLKQSDPSKTSDEDEWETVGPKNRTAITRVYSYQDSPLSEVFGGQIRSIVKSKGSKASATVQPFLLLHLEIVPEAVHSVEDALKLFAAPESLEGYKSTGKAEVVTASKSVKIQALPKVLILHLMRFSFGARGTGKVNKPVRFPLEFTLGRELLYSPYGSGSEARKYELVATVTHHGKDHSMGHYTADAKQFDGRWLRFDDGMVSFVNLNRVLHDQAYILFYKKSGLG
ncbi:hypothetical protein O6H91_12G046100 [Diphasiastrum complanatum]|uniref:Uncharacterized protein n=3 Tax=Diphasiastrum complanatum TaxID=34168 RepID=A0ACC2C1R2_DIPCM|nr:hypothetical protein O6H91_12G046100 [Diphasiastrum complanatum]KAJ7535793.1 hypothetical protein O6H91_12G046100 [Diphasiastrum complanatum]KAJ7535794.1 hypothetical protein O6H91_12G046100 [Diphasiastrum complanatum]